MELRNHISALEHQIAAEQKVLAELKEHDPELNDVILACYKHGVEVRVNHHIRPNSNIIETHGVSMRLFHDSSIKWECVIGKYTDSIISQHMSLAEVISYLREKVLTSV